MRVWVVIFSFLMLSAVHAAEKGFYWIPHVNWGILYNLQGNPISTSRSHIKLIGGGYQFSQKLGATVKWLTYPEYKAGLGVHEAWGGDGVVRYSPDIFQQQVFSRRIQGYGQLGVWYAKSLLSLNTEIVQKYTSGKYLLCKGAGIAIGCGAYCEVFPRLLVDVSWKRLIALPLFKENPEILPIASTGVFTVALGVRLL